MAEIGASLTFTDEQTGGTQYGILPDGAAFIDISDKDSAAFQVTVTDVTPAAATSAAASWATSDIITLTAHGFFTGLVGQVTTSGALPTGISAATNYYVRALTVDTISLYDTYAHATAASGTTGIVNITNIGSGNHTFTPTALDVDIQPEYSLNGTDFWTVTGEDEAVTATGTYGWKITDTFAPMVRIGATVNAGAANIAGYYYAK